MDHFTAVQSVFPSILSAMNTNCQDCTGILYKMWVVGYAIYFAWMAICMSFVVIGSLY